MAFYDFLRERGVSQNLIEKMMEEKVKYKLQQNIYKSRLPPPKSTWRGVIME